MNIQDFKGKICTNCNKICACQWVVKMAQNGGANQVQKFCSECGCPETKHVDVVQTPKPKPTRLFDSY